MKEINNYMKELLADIWYELGNFIDSVKWRVSDYVQEWKYRRNESKLVENLDLDDSAFDEPVVEKPKKSKRGRPKKKK